MIARVAEPPGGPRDVMLWQAAKRILERHRVHLRQGDLPACEFCGAPWPCEPSVVAQRALVVAGPALGRRGTVWIYVSDDTVGRREHHDSHDGEAQ